MSKFSELELLPALRQGLEAAAFSKMTAIQAASLPPILAGRDVIAQAKTGSGKTAAFALGLLSAIDLSMAEIQGLVLCPTRELAEQVSREIRRLARFLPNTKVQTLCGGLPVRQHLIALEKKPHLVVGTPGRLLDLLQQNALPLTALRVLVLDEADRMLDMGFSEEIAAITAAMPQVRQTLLFSATYSDGVRAISKSVQTDALDVTVAAILDESEVQQTFYEVEDEAKFDALRSLLNERSPASAAIFCNTKHESRALAQKLSDLGHSVLALHGDLEQRDRDEVLLRFANGTAVVLVATDVAARGLDIKALPMVINYDMALDPDIHLHRIGRTGRAGSKGHALSLCTHRERTRIAADIESEHGATLTWGKLRAAQAYDRPLRGEMATMVIDGGRQDKLRPGDLLGALTGDAGLAAGMIGKIDIFPTRAYVALNRKVVSKALSALRDGKIKGRKFRLRTLDY